MSKLVRPHGGGELKPLLLTGDALAAEKTRAASLPKVTMSSRETGDLIMLGIGGFTPLEGYMTHADWEGVCDGYKMASVDELADEAHKSWFNHTAPHHPSLAEYREIIEEVLG